MYQTEGPTLQGAMCRDQGSGLEGLSEALREQARLGETRGKIFSYGPGKRKDRNERNKRLIRTLFPAYALHMEKNEKEAEEEEERHRIPAEELREFPELLVQNINFHIQGEKRGDGKPLEAGNAEAHHTNRFSCCKGKHALPVFRRGQDFKMTITFNRPFDPERDNVIMIVETGEGSLGETLSERLRLDDRREEPWTKGEYWEGRVISEMPQENAIRVALYIPGTCVIGEWDLKVVTALKDRHRECVYTHPQPLTVLFNPWSEQDQVYYTGDKTDLEEYVLNDQGVVFHAADSYIPPRPWTYGQFEEDILQISLSVLREAFDHFSLSLVRQAFGFKLGNPVKVARALSAVVNKGVLTGNWSGDYRGGTDPFNWSASTTILRQYAQDGNPVKFGQCWTFAHVLTTVCRALGLPCRNVTKDVNELKAAEINSSWNFHMWNEVWMQRPDIEGRDCNGWQVLDSTPQGLPWCGPCPVKAVLNWWIDVPFDVGFVVGQVYTDMEIRRNSGNRRCLETAQENESKENGDSGKADIDKSRVLKLILWTMDGQGRRVDLTSTYKHPEGSKEQIQSAMSALNMLVRAQRERLTYEQTTLTIPDQPRLTMKSDLHQRGDIHTLFEPIFWKHYMHHRLVVKLYKFEYSLWCYSLYLQLFFKALKFERFLWNNYVRYRFVVTLEKFDYLLWNYFLWYRLAVKL